jgi:ribosome recycling factor
VMQELRDLKKDGEIGADDEHRAETELQKLTDEKIAEIDSSLAAKEDEILQV